MLLHKGGFPLPYLEGDFVCGRHADRGVVEGVDIMESRALLSRQAHKILSLNLSCGSTAVGVGVESHVIGCGTSSSEDRIARHNRGVGVGSVQTFLWVRLGRRRLAWL